MSYAAPATKRADFLRPGTWIGAARLVAGPFLVWALAAGFLHWASPELGTPGRVFVFTESIGMVFIGAVAMLSRARLLHRLGALRRWLLTASIAIPVAYYGGNSIASLIVERSLKQVAGPGPNYMVPVVLGLVLAAFVMYVIATREQLASTAIAHADAQRLATESELRLLRARLEPHMLFNTLANMRSLVNEDPDQAERMIDQLIVYLRSALAASHDEVSTLEAEFVQLRAYLDIMSLRMGPRLAYRLELPGELEPTSIPPMLLQPLVENAIKHGLEPKVGAGSVEVIARACDGGIVVSVNDSGLGLPVQEVAGYGLKNVRERLERIYGPHASLTLRARTPHGVCAVVRIPS